MASIPSTMKALVAPEWCSPSQYEVITVSVPQLQEPDDLLLRVHAVSINPADVKLASGIAKVCMKQQFPFRIGYDVAGVVVAVGSSVTQFQIGDEVVSRVPEKHRGTIAEYALSSEAAVARKPPSISFSDAASLPLVALTAIQALDVADKTIPGGIKGKTVFVPGGLSGTGSMGIQLAKHHYGAAKIITTVSSRKISLVNELLGPGVVDQIVDYTREDFIQSIGLGTVDVLYDTMSYTLSAIPVMKRGGMIVSVSTPSSGKVLKDFMPDTPWWLVQMLNGVSRYFHWKVNRKGVKYHQFFIKPSGQQVQTVVDLVEEGKVRPVVGSKADFHDLDAVRNGCEQVLGSRGTVGKFVVEF